MIHGMHHNAYRCRYPNGYVIELTAKLPSHADAIDPAKNGAREKLARWAAAKRL